MADDFAPPPPTTVSTGRRRCGGQLWPLWAAVGLTLWTAAAAGLFHGCEGPMEPWGYADAVGFSLDLLTSAGFAAGLEPQSVCGRLVGLSYPLAGLPALLLLAAWLGRRLAALLRLLGLAQSCRLRQSAWRQLAPGGAESRATPVWLPAVLLVGWLPAAAGLLLLTGGPDGFAEAIWLHSGALLGLGTSGRLPAAARLVDFALRLVGLVLLAATFALAADNIAAANDQLADRIDMEFQTALGADRPLAPAGLSAVRREIRRLAPLSSLLVDTKAAEAHWTRRAKMTSTACQTRETSFTPRVYGVGAAPGDFRRSKDDVSRLMADVDARLIRSATKPPPNDNQNCREAGATNNNSVDPQANSTWKTAGDAAISVELDQKETKTEEVG